MLSRLRDENNTRTKKANEIKLKKQPFALGLEHLLEVLVFTNNSTEMFMT